MANLKILLVEDESLKTTDIKRRLESFGYEDTYAQKIVQRHHGKIWAESELGKGSTFYFTIPPINNSTK